MRLLPQTLVKIKHSYPIMKRNIFIYSLLVFLITGKATAQTDHAETSSIENLVFEGAGIRGIAYSGVIKELEGRGMMEGIKKVGGTSAGAITSMMVALGYNSDEIYKIISETKFQKFNDGGMMLAGGIYRLCNKFGWYRGDAFTRWVENIIAAKTGNSDITFRQLEEQDYKQLYVTATCLNRQKLLILSAETYPDMKIKDAVRISMSVPLYFEAVFIDSNGHVYKKPRKRKGLDIVVDGGIKGNFPIFIFDTVTTDAKGNEVRIPNHKTIGIRIDSDEQIMQDDGDKELAAIEINNLSDYMQAFYILALENLNRNQLIPEDWKRTISVSDAGIGPKVKKMSEKQKQMLIRSGEENTIRFFEKKSLN